MNLCDAPWLPKRKAPVPTLVGSVVTERIIDLLVMGLLAMLCLLLQFEQFWGFFDQYLLQPALNYMVPILIGMACSVAVLFWLKNKKKQTSNHTNHDKQTSPQITWQKSNAKETIFTKFSGGIQSVFQLENPLAFILASLGIWIGYWLNTYFMLKSLDVTVDFTLANALGVLIFSTLGVIVPLPGGAGVWGTLAYGLTLIYGLPQDQANTFGIYSVAVSNLLMIVFGSISYLLLYLEIQKQVNMKLKDKIVSMNVAQSMVNQWQNQGDKVVFTNGCFDILHAGHVHYLEEARCLGNKLVIGLNTDQSIQRLDKSPARPIQSQDSRAMVLAALDSVSLVVLFDEDTPKELIETLNPNILVKGADYQIDQIVGGSHVIANGGEVKTLEFLPGYSTSKIEQKILKSHGK